MTVNVVIAPGRASADPHPEGDHISSHPKGIGITQTRVGRRGLPWVTMDELSRNTESVASLPCHL
jgi:hypothetical protein